MTATGVPTGGDAFGRRLNYAALNRNPAEAGSRVDQVHRISSYGGNTPVPFSDTPSGVAVALVAMRSVADLLPVTVGVNVTPIVQEAPAARLAGQSFVCAKYLALVPVSVMPSIT